METMEHPFAQYIKMLGKGRRGSRDLSQQEAEQAMAMILAGQVEPEQLGAFLMLMRVKEETAAEVAGFTLAARAALTLPANLPAVDLDWSTYAGKRRQLPWYLLSALLLSSHGVAVLMHGIGAGTAGRIYVPQALATLGLEPAGSIADAAASISRSKFAYLPLHALSPSMEHLLELKAVLGLRSPVHTLIRMLNPFSAPASIMGIFHPGYDVTHQQAGALLGDQNLAVFKGEGGEAERNPDSACTVRMIRAGNMLEEEWPALFGSKHLKDEAMDASRLLQLWRGEIEDEYGRAAVSGTAAIALRMRGRADGIADAEALAARMWETRNIGYLATAS
jgi:anthranilate phosphoribosyltransferase